MFAFDHWQPLPGQVILGADDCGNNSANNYSMIDNVAYQTIRSVRVRKGLAPDLPGLSLYQDNLV